MRSEPMEREEGPTPDLYRDAGVDTEAADAGLTALVRRLRGTWPAAGTPGAVALDIGYFANVVRFGGTGLALCTDGVGSKAIIAQMMHRYDTVGIDCVAMNVNDLICVGARPLSMVDYIAVQTARADLLDALSVGLAEGARQAGVSICGGEISQMKDIIGAWRPGYGFDLVGMAVGEVALEKVNCGAAVEAGDAVIGIASNGVHSNGLSLARRAFFELNAFDLGETFGGALPQGLGEALLAPTFIYVREVMEIVETVAGVKAMAHITSDGLLNLTRVAAPVSFEIDALPPPPAIFDLIARHGGVGAAEMFQVFNMGIGFCLVVAAEAASPALSILKAHGRAASVIGHAVADPAKTVKIGKALIGRGKRFQAV